MIVIDTQVVVWLDAEPSKLSAGAVALMTAERRKGEPLAISGITLLELAHGISRGRIPVKRPLGPALRSIEQVYRVLPITADIAEQSTRFTDPFPKDPADRIIAATAFVHGVPLITADDKLRDSGQVACIW